MSIKSIILNFVEVVMSLFTAWLSVNKKELAWCPIRVNNRIDD